MSPESPLLLEEGLHEANGMRVSFSNLEYALPSLVCRRETNVVLKSMSGYLNPGEMTAVMGPSGSGKTMLLDILAGRRSGGRLGGSIKYGSRSPTPAFLRRHIGYVEQFSSLIENLTVFEMLLYTAELKRPTTERVETKKQVVNCLIDKLALTPCRDIKIGNPHTDRGISGGEGKRVNIGLSLLTNPSVLYMDEPISGLDSYTANEVMECTKALVDDGTAVCATLHSPSPFIFCLFDKILLLVEGNMVFFGSRREVVGYFESLGVESSFEGQSIAESLTEIIVKADHVDAAAFLVEGYQQSLIKKETEEIALNGPDNASSSMSSLSAAHTDLAPQGSSTKSFWFALRVLLVHRSYKSLRTPSFWIKRSLDRTVIVIFMGTIYKGLGNSSLPINYPNIGGLLFFWVAFATAGAMVYLPSMILERWVFYREQRDGLYPPITYLMSKVVEEFTAAVILSLVHCSILWVIVDLQGSFVRFVATFFGLFCTGISAVLLCGSIAPSLEVAGAIFASYLMTLLFYCGYLILPRDIPWYLKWYSKIDFLRYSYGALMSNHFRSIDDPLADIYLEYVGWKEVNVDWYIGIVYLFVVFFLLISFLSTSFLRFNRKF